MIDNCRNGLLWYLFMSACEVRTGLFRLGFDTPRLSEGGSKAFRQPA